MLTGDSLFVGDAARPDLAVEPRDGAEGLYRSLHRLVELGDGVEVYPGHVAGSMCGKAMSSKGSTTIGFERRFNPMLRLDELEDFVAESVGTAGVRPPNVERIVALNRGPFVAAQPPLEARDTAPPGAAVLDVRTARAFADGHAPGALNVPGLRLLLRDEGRVRPPRGRARRSSTPRRRRRRSSRRAGSTRSACSTSRAGRVAPDRRRAAGVVTVEELRRLVDEDAVDVVDVREADERDDGYIPGSRHVPYRLVGAFAESMGNGKPVVTICESGARAAVAASVLAAHGVDARPVLDGGMDDWDGADDPLPPLRVVALHGAGSGPWVFDGWHLQGHELEAVDLQAGLNVAAASMLNYEAVATRACDGVERPFALLGWSMGGLVAMMAVRRVEPDALVLLEPSPPDGRDPNARLAEGVYDPQEVYGPFPEGVRSRPESLYARAERLRGIPVPSLPARTLVVSGDEFADERGTVARRFGAEELHAPGLDHWALVLDPGVQRRIADWLSR